MNRKRSIPYKITFFIIGIASTVWFLVRVIPKPTRAGYPCMKAAAPFMSSFVIYLLSVTGSALLFKRSRQFFYRARYFMTAGAFLGALVLFALSSNIFLGKLNAASKGSVAEDYPANQPIGEELGIFPGRVVWAWDPDATDENCTNEPDHTTRGEDGYFLAKNSDQAVINSMMDDVVLKLTGTYDVQTAWDSLFIDFNMRKGLDAVSYQDGQTIFIKINMGTGDWLTNSSLERVKTGWQIDYYGISETSPAMVISLLDQLVNHAGIPQENIYLGDPKAHIFQDVYEQMATFFPGVKYVDRDEKSEFGRTMIHKAADPSIKWSDKGAVVEDLEDLQNPNDTADYLYAEMEDADYLINLATLKAHARAGITLTAKNHFGSHTRNNATHLHPGLVSKDNDVPYRTEYGMYRVLTDIMGHEKLGGNTVLFIVEGLWGGPEATLQPVKWNSAPFNGDWPNSILASQDAVALESVCFDLLKTEFKDPDRPGAARPWFGAVDDHLHQAADSENWPEDFRYDPEGDGTPMGSMGIHEHWNNEFDKQYSRNLGYGYGIELVPTDKSLISTVISALEAVSTPVIDADPSDQCWTDARWYYMDETWIKWGEEIDSADFYARFKVSWSESENLIYYFIEVTDDFFVDGYLFPEENYPDFDIVEIFIDENRSGGLHVFDDNAQWGDNAENAFSYHLAMNAPAEGESVSDFFACDIAGTNWPATIMDYADHFPEMNMRKVGNRYLYELSMKVFDDTYDDIDPEASRVVLVEGKEMGLSLAYCDNDIPGTERDNFFGSVWVPEEAYNDHWKSADGFGSVRLVKSGTTLNHPVEVVGSIDDFQIIALESDTTIHHNINELFSDPDGDTLSYTVNCEEHLLAFTIDGNQLEVNAGTGYKGTTNVELVASDGEFEAKIVFKVFRNITSRDDRSIVEVNFRCYPNPSTGLLYVELDAGGMMSGDGMVEVYNLDGRKVVAEIIKGVTGGRSVVSLDLSGVLSGYYIVELRLNGVIYSRIIHKI
ncbi:MAG: sugar-binding protein [Bacteroidota bacterium]